MNPFSLQGKTVLITGASSGIGKGIAVECSRMGAVCMLNARNTERLKETLGILSGTGHQIIPVDLSNQSGVEQLVSQLPKLDGCVFAAGIPQICPVKYFKREDIETIFSVNSIAPMMITSALLKNKKISRGSSLVYIESVSGVFVGTKADVSYNASKAALNGFVKGAALELAGQGIRINAINPGLVPTNILNLSDKLSSGVSHVDLMQDKYPLKRLGTVEDIAYGVIYLLSNASSWVTGSNLVIDGGYTLN